MIKYFSRHTSLASAVVKFKKNKQQKQKHLTLVLLNPDMSCFPNSVDSDQLVSEEANCSGSALFVIKYVNLY